MELFKGQDFSKIRKDQFDTGVPWTDPTFPPENTSIGHSKSSKLPRVVKWLRPSVSPFLVMHHFTYITINQWFFN